MAHGNSFPMPRTTSKNLPGRRPPNPLRLPNPLPQGHPQESQDHRCPDPPFPRGQSSEHQSRFQNLVRFLVLSLVLFSCFFGAFSRAFLVPFLVLFWCLFSCFFRAFLVPFLVLFWCFCFFRAFSRAFFVLFWCLFSCFFGAFSRAFLVPFLVPFLVLFLVLFGAGKAQLRSQNLTGQPRIQPGSGSRSPSRTFTLLGWI